MSAHAPTARRRFTHLGSPGGRERGRSGRGRGGRKSTRNTSCPVGQVSAVGRALTFFMGDQSPKSRDAEAAPVSLSRHSIPALLFLSLPSSSVAARSPLEIRARTKAEVWTSPRACHDSLGFTEIFLASLSPKASHPPTPPRTPKLEPPFLFFYASPNRAGNQSDLARLRPQQKINTSLHAYYSFTKSPRALESLL